MRWDGKNVESDGFIAILQSAGIYPGADNWDKYERARAIVHEMEKQLTPPAQGERWSQEQVRFYDACMKIVSSYLRI